MPGARLQSLFVVALLAAFAGGCATITTGGDADDDTYTSRTPGEDGRFTIGTGQKRLMYGYPVPYSTSHFVLAIDGKYASNNPRFGREVEYLTGTLLVKGSEASAHTKITYRFNDVEITQRLVPVDKDFRDVGVGNWGQYYRIEYDITNKADATRTVGLMLLIDTMIDDNDACVMDADGSRVAQQAAFAKGNIPGEVLVYRVPGSNAELVASLVTNKGKAVRPDAMYVGRWPYLHSVVWDVNLAQGGYTDSGILLRWDTKPLEPGAKHYLATHYGLPKPGRISALTNAANEFQRHEASVYFDLGKADLKDEGKTALDQLLADRTPAGVFVEVYTDARGNEATNLQLSKRRAEAVITYLKGRNVSPALIIPKSYGESYADQSEEARQQGKQEDRKATVVLLTR